MEIRFSGLYFIDLRQCSSVYAGSAGKFQLFDEGGVIGDLGGFLEVPIEIVKF